MLWNMQSLEKHQGQTFMYFHTNYNLNVKYNNQKTWNLQCRDWGR